LRDLCATLNDHVLRVELCIDAHLHRDVKGCRVSQGQPLVEMLIFDEAERLSMTALKCIRAMFDRTGVGVILIGMPGMEKRLSRYPQLYSRGGCAHHYRPLQDNVHAQTRILHQLAQEGYLVEDEVLGAPAASAGKFTVSSLEPHMHSSHF
jgi:DNA transposition AAA+ family ATPase